MIFDILPEAKRDIEKAFRHYRNLSIELGEAFTDRLEYCLNKIRDNPHTYGILRKSAKAATLKRFPYVVYFQVTTEIVRVVAVLHAKRNPRIWRKRLR